MNATTLTAVLEDLLAACVAAYALPGAPPVPERTFVTHGQPPALATTDEKAQLVVWSSGVRPVKPMPLSQLGAVKTSIVPAADLFVEVLRPCWPAPHVSAAAKQTPNPAAFTDAALTLAGDASVLFSHIATLAAAGTLFPSLAPSGRAGDLSLGTMSPREPAGRFAGWRWPISVKLAVGP